MSLPQRLSTTEAESSSSPSKPQSPSSSAGQDYPEVESLASAIKKAGMAGPALMLLHTFKPLAWVGGQLLWMLEPFFGSGRASNGSSPSFARIAGLLEREEQVDRLAGLLG